MSCVGSQRSRRGVSLLLAGCLGLLAGPPAPAQEAEDAVPPPVGLESLLRLPRSSPPPAQLERRGGATRREWKARFEAARADLDDASRALDQAQKELEAIAVDTDNWQMAAPGSQASADSSAPLNYRLRQEIRRQREQVERADKALKDLTIEANLAGVPQEWQN